VGYLGKINERDGINKGTGHPAILIWSVGTN
jgi:hypothetical protein